MQLVVQVLVQAVPIMIAGILVTLTVCLVFGIMGTHMFAGKFYYCYNETAEEFFLSSQVHNRSDCNRLISENMTEVRWKNGMYNFDNTVNGYISLMHLVSVRTWHPYEKWLVKSSDKEALIIHFQLQIFEANGICTVELLNLCDALFVLFLPGHFRKHI